MGEGVTSIGGYAFKDCSGLTSITIGSSVTRIGQCAFLDCSGLTSVTIPNSVTSIGYYAFNGCSGLTSITVESGNTVFDSRNNCNAIIVTTSNTLIAGCMNTIIPESVTSIGNHAFYGCSALTSVIIPESVTSIGNYAFYGCSGLTSIVVESGNTVYDSRDNCNAIIETATNTLIRGCMNTIIPNSVTSIGDGAFGYCSGLTSITIPNSVTSIGYFAFGLCSGLTSVTIPEGVTSIGSHAFDSCHCLTSITIPENVTSIEEETFYGCRSLTTVTIGSGVTSIGKWTFWRCSGLQSIICYAKETPEVKEDTFEFDRVSRITLQVPRESVQKYKDHPVWGKFKIEVITGIEDVWSGESGEDFERSIYDLSGRRLPAGRMPQGIFIRNGKKIAVK